MDSKEIAEKIAKMEEDKQTQCLREILANGTHQLALRTKDGKLEAECRMQLHNLLDLRLDKEQAAMVWLEEVKKKNV